MTVEEANQILWERDEWPSSKVREALDVLQAAAKGLEGL